MSTPKTVATIPVAWLRPLPEGYKIPLWRWILLPPATWMMHRSGGTWVGGDLSLRTDDLCFSKTSMLKAGKGATADWYIRLSDISNVTLTKGMASETIEIHYSGRIAKIMSARSSDFVALLNQAALNARGGSAERPGEPTHDP